MKVLELADKLIEAHERYGDIECLVEVIIDDCVCLMPADELSFEDREGFGRSLTIIC